MVILVLPLPSWRSVLIVGVDGIAILTLGVLVENTPLEDDDDLRAVGEAVLNNDYRFPPCACVDTVAGVILPFDGMSISVIVLMDLLYDDCGSFK